MLNISGGLYQNTEIDTPSQEVPFLVTSCGHYQLLKRPRFDTWRPAGRRDYQLLYILRGRGAFALGEHWHTLTEGQMLLYYPLEPQHYRYELADAPSIYWLHFTGSQVPAVLASFDLTPARIFTPQVKSAYSDLFDRIIRELQLKRPHFSALANSYFYELLARMSRAVSEGGAAATRRHEQVEQAVQHFHARFHEDFCLADYAQDCHMSPCWFTRLFHRQMGVSPQQYLTGIRVNKARELLRSSSYNIGEVAALVGYQNPLYFSRIFKAHTGLSPSAYRKSCVQSDPPALRE